MPTNHVWSLSELFAKKNSVSRKNGVAGKIDLASIIYGDVTGDGKVMINDAAKVAQAVGKTITLTEEEAINIDMMQRAGNSVDFTA